MVESARMPRNIVVYSDGTGQDGGVRAEQRLSNVYKMYRASRVGPDSAIDPALQVAFYDAGLGTDDDVKGFGRFTRTIGKFLALVGARADWRGCAPLPRCRVYFANHSSHFDTLAIMAALPSRLRAVTHPVAALDYWGRSRLRRFIALDCLHAILIDRKADKDTADPLAPLVGVLEHGQSLVFFPEGTRGSGEDIAPFKSGLFHLAGRCPQAELVPVYLDNLARIMPKGSALIVPITCTARFGAPLALMPGEDKASFLARCRAAMMALSTAKAG